MEKFQKVGFDLAYLTEYMVTVNYLFTLMNQIAKEIMT